ncbi:MAG: metallophosphoesterase [Nanoarchaeota archaeon]
MDIVEIDDDIAIIGKAALVRDSLIISDVHVGFEEALNKEGFLVPRTLFDQLFEELEELLMETRPKRVIVNGDFKHEFGRISRQEWRDTFKLVEMIMNYSRLILLKGNHDTILGPIAEKYDISINDHTVIDDVYITHGDALPENEEFKKAKKIIIGHEHPCVTVRDEHKFEKFKVFLKGSFDDKELIVLPSFNPVEGADVTKAKLISPFLKKNRALPEFDVYVTAEDKVYPFGKLREFMK